MERINIVLDDITRTIAARGDLAHLVLFLWASGASGLLVWALRELVAHDAEQGADQTGADRRA